MKTSDNALIFILLNERLKQYRMFLHKLVITVISFLYKQGCFMIKELFS